LTKLEGRRLIGRCGDTDTRNAKNSKVRRAQDCADRPSRPGRGENSGSDSIRVAMFPPVWSSGLEPTDRAAIINEFIGLRHKALQARSYGMVFWLSFCTPSASQFRERLVAPLKPGVFARRGRPGFPPGRTMRLAKAHRTIERRIRVSQRGGGSARCSGSRALVQPRNSCQRMPPSTTSSTSNAISPQPKRTASFALWRWTRGGPPSQQQPENS
jgi:hypothetical protein